MRQLDNIDNFENDNRGTIPKAFARALANQYVLAGLEHKFTSKVEVYDYIFSKDVLVQACEQAGLKEDAERELFFKDVVECWDNARELQHGIVRALCINCNLD